MILYTVAAEHHAPDEMDFDLRESVIYAALAADNFGLFMRLGADALRVAPGCAAHIVITAMRHSPDACTHLKGLRLR